jgi:hypothetical protein
MERVSIHIKYQTYANYDRIPISPARLERPAGGKEFSNGTGQVRAYTALRFLDDPAKSKSTVNRKRMCAYCT